LCYSLAVAEHCCGLLMTIADVDVACRPSVLSTHSKHRRDTKLKVSYPRQQMIWTKIPMTRARAGTPSFNQHSAIPSALLSCVTKHRTFTYLWQVYATFACSLLVYGRSRHEKTPVIMPFLAHRCAFSLDFVIHRTLKLHVFTVRALGQRTVVF
jgi:hypothetical protein